MSTLVILITSAMVFAAVWIENKTVAMVVCYIAGVIVGVYVGVILMARELLPIASS